MDLRAVVRNKSQRVLELATEGRKSVDIDLRETIISI
jgi:hypothetical protein